MIDNRENCNTGILTFSRKVIFSQIRFILLFEQNTFLRGLYFKITIEVQFED